MKRYFKKLGFEEKEAELYLACLAEDRNTPASLVRRTGFKRTTVYFYLEKLRRKGFIESHVKGKKQFYLARLPEEAFNNFFEQKEDRLDEQKLVFQKLLPKLTKTAKKRNFNTKVTFWEGREGIISMVN